MKKFLLKVGLFFVVLIILDRVFGMAFAYMGDHAKGGYIGHHKYVTDKVNEDILVFGSSRAIHHYNPQVLTDSLGMTCYNCGQDGNGIILFYGLWQMIKEHHKPKMIIYDVSTGFDLYKGENNQKFLGWLRADYDRPGVKQIFDDVDCTEKYKMLSMLYRYNSKFMQNITDFVHPIFGIEGNGYIPLNGEMDKMKVKDESSNHELRTVDSQKLDFLNKLIDETNGVELVFVASPMWYQTLESDYQPIKDLCEQRGVRFIDFSNKEKYIHQYEWFKDGAHLNAKGADEFTRDLISVIK